MQVRCIVPVPSRLLQTVQHVTRHFFLVLPDLDFLPQQLNLDLLTWLINSQTPSSPSQPQNPNDYFPFLASMPKEREWKAKEDRYLLEAAKRGDTFSVMSKTLIRPEQVCRNRVAHLIRVLQRQLAGRSTVLDEELLNAIKQEIAERSGELGGDLPSEPENALGSDEEREDDAIMKLVIWKFYQRRGALDPAVIETHEGLREELDTFEWIEPQLLRVAARVFIKRRAEACRQRNPSGSQVVDG